MAVGASYYTLVNLTLQHFQGGPIVHQLIDILELAVLNVVELEYNRIFLGTVYTVLLLQEAVDILTISFSNAPLLADLAALVCVILVATFTGLEEVL